MFKTEEHTIYFAKIKKYNSIIRKKKSIFNLIYVIINCLAGPRQELD